jgi:hypothetical protein
MESLKRSFEHLKNVIVSSNPNLWYAMMMEALGHFENEFNQYLESKEPLVKEHITEPTIEFIPALGDDEVREMVLDEWERKSDLVEDESEEVIPEPTVVKKPVVKKTTKQ